MSAHWERVAGAQHGERYAEAYAERFAALAAIGADVHGEARCVQRLAPAPSRVLDAGCGTGRVAARLADLGHLVVGCDADPSMLAVARRDRPDLTWQVADLAALGPAQLGAPFDVVLLAGNVVPLIGAGPLPAAARGVASVLRPGGLVVAGFGLDAAHLPTGCAPVPLDALDAAMADAALVPDARWSTWDGAPYDGGGYVVVVHRGRT